MSSVLPSAHHARVLRWVVLTCFGSALAVLFHVGFTFPIRVGVVLFVLITTAGVFLVRVSMLSLLPRFMIFIFSLPFSVLFGYLLDPDYAWMYTPRGMEIIQDPMVIREMLTVGLVGLLGLVSGIQLAGLRYRSWGAGQRLDATPPRGRALDPLVYVVLCVVSVILSWMSAPPNTIFEAAYAGVGPESVAASVNFPAAYLLSYILAVMLVLDAEREGLTARRRFKLAVLGVTVIYIVIVLQVLRGDRESSGLVVALAALYLTSRVGLPSMAAAKRVVRHRLRRLVLPLALLMALFLVLGAIRSRMSGAADAVEQLDASETFKAGLALNTWTAVLWTNLGMAWEYRHGIIQLKWGSTYIDYLLSLPPGAIAKLFGYVRPMEAWQGINWEDQAGVSAGGLHAVIAPFKNFGAPGVFGILFIFGYVIGSVEAHGETGSFGRRLLWGAVFCTGFTWFWYGDMPFVRALMAAGLLYVTYRVALSVRLGRGPVAAGRRVGALTEV
jgi:hypothetical protein